MSKLLQVHTITGGWGNPILVGTFCFLYFLRIDPDNAARYTWPRDYWLCCPCRVKGHSIQGR